MPVQVWIQTQKENVQKVKLILEEAGQLSKQHKVKPGQEDGYMIIPTNTYREEKVDDDAGYYGILSDLHLSAANQFAAAEIVYLPCPLPGHEPSDAKLGPIQEAISEWMRDMPELSMCETGPRRIDLLETSPRRWSIYEPMLLLPSGSFQDARWKALLDSLDESQLFSLWRRILHSVWKKEGGQELTHLAINSGIPSKQASHTTMEEQTTETQTPPEPDRPYDSPSHSPSAAASAANILRSPSGLIVLHGAFGPPTTTTPTATDFHAAFWASTRQNGIVQTWAPRHTMFSRGNIKEKSRILAFHEPPDPGAHTAPATTALGAERRMGSAERGQAAVVDLYAGIGYFAFSYAAAGFGTVLCWEINPWSVEGLRRGCLRNGWSCRVVRGGELQRPVEELLQNGERIIVFEEGNEMAVGRMEAVRKWQERNAKSLFRGVLHVNCGFLPSSEASWECAWKILCKSRRAWLHLHENVGVDDVEKRRKEIDQMIGQWARKGETSLTVEVEHVEYVKTFAPGVWHCVFDVYVQPKILNKS